MKIAVVVIIAFILDLLFGDPRFIPHPICIIGNIISKGEKLIRHVLKKSKKAEFTGGVILTVITVSICYTVPFFILYFLSKINFYLSTAVEIIFCYQILAAKSLKTESMKVYYPLKKGDLPEARKFLSWIVGRDTKSLDAAGITKGTVETIAENTSDGVIAPLIFMAIGGAPLGFLYKSINTLDSMIGYKNDKYLYFGRFAAKLDDIANFIPARVSALLMITASWVLRLDVKNAWEIYLRDRKKHASPNSAQTESVCAGALNIQLGGDAYYFGKLYKKHTMGEANRDIIVEDIISANRLMYGASILGVLVTCAVRTLANLYWGV